MHHLPNVSGPFYSSFSFILLPFFFLFVFFVSLLLFGILSQHFLYRLGTFFSFFPFAPFSPYIIFWFSFSDCSFLLSFYALFSVSLRRFVASKIAVKSKWDRYDEFTKKKKKEKKGENSIGEECSSVFSVPSRLSFLAILPSSSSFPSFCVSSSWALPFLSRFLSRLLPPSFSHPHRPSGLPFWHSWS